MLLLTVIAWPESSKYFTINNKLLKNCTEVNGYFGAKSCYFHGRKGKGLSTLSTGSRKNSHLHNILFCSNCLTMSLTVFYFYSVQNVTRLKMVIPVFVPCARKLGLISTFCDRFLWNNKSNIFDV